MDKIKNYIQKLISAFVIIFCFIFFPLFLFYTFLDIYFENQIDKRRQNIISEMDNSLNYLNKYSSNKKYIHFLLSKIAEYAQKSNNPIEYLKANISNLKKQYPDSFQFIVWDKDGKIQKELTDKTGYNYVLTKLFECLKKATQEVKKDSSIRIINIDFIKQNINILKKFFGNVFITENLKLPIINTVNSGPFISNLGQDYSNVWFSINKKISFLCFISEKMINDVSGLVKITNQLTDNNSQIIYGFSVDSSYEKSVTKFPVKYESILKLALSTFENGGDSVFENERALVKILMPQSKVRTFAFLPKNEDFWNYKDKRNSCFAILSCFLLFLYSFLGFWFIYKKHFFSIKWKLISLFLFANIVPVVILVLLTNVYIDSKRISLKSEILDNLEKSIRELDVEYNYLLDDYSSKLSKVCDNISKKVGISKIQESEVTELNNISKNLEVSYFYLIASSSEVISHFYSDKNTALNLDLMSTMAKAILNFSNNKDLDVDVDKTKFFGNIYNPRDSGFIRSFLRNLEKVTDILIAEKNIIYYSYLFGNRKNYNNNYFFMLVWDKNYFQNLFLRLFFKNIYNNLENALFFVKSSSGDYFYGSNELESILTNILEKNPNLSGKVIGESQINNEKYFYICLKGTNLSDWYFVAAYPTKNIDYKIYVLITQIIAGIIVSILFTLIIGQMLAINFLNPIRNLGEATLAINQRDFSYSVPIVDEDEFGYLNGVFNRVIEGLGDFEVARIIQESLFPGNNFDVGIFKIFGKSVVMTTLGGDYYDCFKINDEYQGIIIGDVAGHGIPAGLMMAMAKSAVSSCPIEVKLDPVALTTRLHKMFFAIKNEKLKRMMTFQYFVLRVSDGHFIYTNAGHCLPIIVDKNTKKANYIDYIATPLGIGPRCRCKNQEFDLQKGQSLILYTDGIVEANNESGEQYGYDRYIENLPKYFDYDPEIFYDNLYNKMYKEWSPKPDDDLTLIIVNRK